MMENVNENLITARIALLIKQPFFGNIATRLVMDDVTDAGWCKTAATDGRKIYFNSDFVRSLSSIGKIEFLLAHEVLHVVLDHIGRTGSRNQRLANIAQDYAINQILVDSEIGEMITEVKPYQDNRFRNMTWEQIYDILEQEDEEPEGTLLDYHMEVTDGNAEDGSPTIGRQEMEEIRAEIREAIIQANQVSAGNMPGAIKRLIQSLTEPKINWVDVIRMNIQSLVRSKFSFSRPSRKSGHSGAILPRRNPSNRIEVSIAVDMSGSINEQMATAFLTEIKGIMEQYTDFKIDLWCFDNDIHNHVTITPDTIDRFLTYEPQGGGGTDFMANWKYMEENGIEPKKFIMFTDGMPWGSWGNELYCDTLFVIKNNREKTAPFGQTLHYEDVTA